MYDVSPVTRPPTHILTHDPFGSGFRPRRFLTSSFVTGGPPLATACSHISAMTSRPYEQDPIVRGEWPNFSW